MRFLWLKTEIAMLFLLFLCAFPTGDVQLWGCPNVSQKGEMRHGRGLQKTWKCSGPAEAFLLHLCLLFTCQAFRFYDLQAIRWMIDSGKPTENPAAKKICTGDTQSKVTASSTCRATQERAVQGFKSWIKARIEELKPLAQVFLVHKYSFSLSPSYFPANPSLGHIWKLF